MIQYINDLIHNNNSIEVFNTLTYKRWKYIAIAVGIVALFLFLRKIFTNYIFKLILRLSSKSKIDKEKKVLLAFETPLRSFFIVLGIYFALRSLTYVFPISILFIDKAFSSAIVILIALGFYNLTEESSVLFEKMQETYDIKVDRILFPFISKALRLVIIALVITIVADKWGYDIKAFITGLGLGGLAFALAAKDAAANIIAGVIIILDKPFSIGDWISCGNLEGVVEDISFRSTKIRTFEQALVTVPNSTLSNDAITNFTRRGKRRINFNLGVSYDTSIEKLQKSMEKMRTMLEGHSGVSKEAIQVRFDKFNNSSLDIFIYFFTNTTDWAKYLEIKEEINFKIMAILEEEKVSVAFPSRSIYLESSKNPLTIKEPSNIEKEE